MTTDTNGVPIILEKDMVQPDFKAADELLRGFRGQYAGRRCFIIGNGPSLKAADLDKLKENGEFSIASNRIFLIFRETDWRPNIYTVADIPGIVSSLPQIQAMKTDLKIVPVKIGLKTYPIEGLIPIRHEFNNNLWIAEAKMPAFSDDITRCVYHGKTITYTNLQIAAYLGFSEIILLGVDHLYAKQQYFPVNVKTYDWKKNPKGYKEGQQLSSEIRVMPGVTQDHFCSDYMDGVAENNDSYFIEATTLAYQAAKQYAEAHGIRIVNATRGGRLGVFKRVPFDSLFRKPKG